MEKEKSIVLLQLETEKLLVMPKKLIIKDKLLDIFTLKFNENNDIRWIFSGCDESDNE